MADTARRNDLRGFAIVAQEALRWADMAEAMRTLVVETQALERDEQELLALAYRNLLQPIRSAWHTITSLLPSPDHPNPCALVGGGGKEAAIRRYREKLEADVLGVCEEVIALLQPLQVASRHDAASLVFLHKMAGDYHRYMAEVTTGAERARAEENAISAYVAGSALAKRVLAGSAPLRLGLALNYSVLCHHHLDQLAQAIAIAQAAVEAAEVGLAGLSREDREDSGSKRGLLVSNLKEWRAEQRRRQQQAEAESKKQALVAAALRDAEDQPQTKSDYECYDDDDNKENESWRSRDFDGIDLLPPSLADLIELGE